MKADLEKTKTRNWALLLYPDSLPDGWEDLLRALLVPAAVSPLHCPDGEGVKGGELKPHYHVFLKFDSNKSYKQVCEIADSFNAPAPRPINSASAYVRYLIHKDNKNKEQFEAGFDAITCYSGFDIDNFITMSRKEYDDTVGCIMRLVREYNLYDFGDLVDFVMDNDMYELFHILFEKSYFFTSYIKSKRNKRYSTIEKERYTRNED